MAGPRNLSPNVHSLPSRAETARNERLQQVGLTRRTASSHKDKAANSEPQEQPTNGSSLAGIQVLPSRVLKISHTEEREPRTKPFGFEEAAFPRAVNSRSTQLPALCTTLHSHLTILNPSRIHPVNRG